MDTESEMDSRLPDSDPTAADAEWKKIQQNTFTRWCNEHLKVVNQYIYNLETDLCDGLKMIALLEVLAHKRVGKHNKKPTFKSQRMENISIALRFIELENIRLVNIDASDIFKGNLKLILGLIWTLILKYQISIPMMDDDDYDSGMTPKQALLAWVKSKMPPTVNVDNFTNDWNNGKVLACLVDAVAPGLMPDCEDLDPKDRLENIKEAMKQAEDWLGVPQILDPADLANPNVDELSVMTYVSYFPGAKLKPGAPLRPKLQPAAKCSASGPGLEPGVRAKIPTHFTVFTHGAGPGKISVNILGPQRKEVHVAVKDNGDDSFHCEYVPLEPGVYDIHIKFQGRHIPKSPFRVEVVPDYDPTACYAQGPGLEPTGVMAGQYTNFEVFAAGAGEGNLHVEVIDPRGGKDVDVIVEDRKDGTYYVEYQPINSGRHNVNVKFGGKHIPKSPFHVMVTPPPQPTKVRAFGPGLEATGQKANSPAPFTIDAKAAGNGELDVFVEGPFGEEKVDIKNNKDGTYSCTYYPTKHGNYVVSITWSGQQIPNSPFNVKVGAPGDKSKIRAYGTGLEKGTAGQRCDFHVDTRGAGVDSLGFAIEGPSQAEVKCTDKGNGTCDVSYFPTVPGQYAVHVTYCEEDIHNSPFMVPIAPPGEAGKCWAEGPGLEPRGIVVGNPAEFTVHTEDAGVAELGVDVLDDNGKKAKVDVKDNRDGTYSCVYYPKQPGKYNVSVKYGGTDIPKSPFNVTVSPKTDPNKVTCEGPGVEPTGVKAREKTWFTVNTTNAGLGDVEVTVKPDTRTGTPIEDVTVTDNGDGTFRVEYTTPTEGPHLVSVIFAGRQIKRSPFRVQVAPGADASKCKPTGDGLRTAYVDQLATFDVDCRGAGEGLLTASVDNPSGAHTDTLVNDHQDGTYTIEYTPFEPGPHKVSVKYAGQQIPGSPYTVDVKSGPDATKCRAYGPGLEQGFTNVPNPFTVETKDAGPGGLSLAVEGPSEAKLDCVDNGDGTCSVNYIPVEAGDYDIHIKYADEHIPGSPFSTHVTSRVEPEKVKCYGPGLEPDVYTAGPNEFMVDTREAGDADLDVTVKQPDGKKIQPEVERVADGMYNVRYVPQKKGPHTIDVKYAGQEVPRSPFRVNAGEPFDARKVKVSGPGVEKPVDCDEVTEFYADCSEAGFAPFGVALDSPSGGPAPEPEIIDEGNGKYTIRYEPEEVGTYSINVKYGDKHVPRSPFRVKSNPVGDPNKVKIVGPGLDGTPLKVGEKAVFKIDARNAGKGKPRVAVTAADGKEVPVEVIDNGDGTYAVEFTPFEPGMLTFDMKYGGRSVPGYPKTLPVKGDKADLEKVKAEFVEDIETLVEGQILEMELDTTEAGIPEGCQDKFTALVKRPSGKVEPAKIMDNHDGTYSVEYTPSESGVHYLTVKYDDVELPDSPFKFVVQSQEPGGAGAVKVFGKGLERGIAREPCEFTIVTRDAGPGGLSLAVEGPSKSEITCVDNEDGSCQVTYVPIEPGQYHVVVKFADEHIPGSPFTARVYLSKDDIDSDMRHKPVVGKPCDVGLDIPDVDLERDIKYIKTTLKRPYTDVEEPIECKINPDKTLGVTFTPYEPGEHLISVLKHGRHVKNSPFSVMVQAPRLGDICPVGHPCEVGVDLPDVILPNEFDKLSATLRRPGSKVDETVNLISNPDGTVSFSFIPTDPGEHFLTVKKDGKPVKGSPFSILVESEEPLKAVNCPVDCALASDELLLPDDFKKLKGTIKRPSSRVEEPLDLKLNCDNSLSCSFVPKETGPHQINVKKNNRPLSDCPYTVRVLSDEPVHEVGRPLGYGLDFPKGCTKNDLKHLEAKLKRPSGDEPEPVKLLVNSDDTLAVHFTPREIGVHYIYITKAGRPVEGSPFAVDVVSRDRYEEVHPVGRTCDIGLDIPGIKLPEDFKRLDASLRRPNSDKQEPLKLELNPDNTLGVSFVPREPGGHEITVKKEGKQVYGSPFLVMVEAAEAVNAVGRPCDCILDIAGLTADDITRLTAGLRRPGSTQEEKLKPKINSDQSISVSFVPREPGEHTINVKKHNQHVSGSPFTVMVTDSLSQSIGRPCGLGLEISGIKLPEDYDDLSATLTRPSSETKEPLKLTLNSDNTLGVSFVPQESGEHFIEVKKKGREVNGSPFSVMVSGPGPADASKVKCNGSGLEYGFSNQPANFTVNTKEAGYGGLGLSIEGPSKAEITCKDNEDGTCTVEYLPTEPGKYTINIKFADEHVPGSPFHALIGGEGAITRSDQDQLQSRKTEIFEDIISFGGPEQKQHDLVVNLADYNINDIKASVVSPSGVQYGAEVVETKPNQYTVRFVPKENGDYLINVKCRGRQIPGSPFKVHVDSVEGGGAQKCIAAGPGLERGLVGTPCKFTVWSKDAGPGGLAVAIEGPAKAEISCRDNGDGSCNLIYLPTEEGEYNVHVRFADQDIPGSPFKVPVTRKEDDRFRNLSVTDLAETGLKVGQSASFSVQTNGPVGKVNATVVSPTGKEAPAIVSDLGGGNYAIRFVPNEFGDHLVNVRFDGVHIPGSPFKIRVGGAEGHPERVKAYGPGLESGRAGVPTEFTVNAVDAGSGALALSVDGPAKVKMNCAENPDGTYQVTYNPMVAGDYQISIRFAGEQIKGSPYHVKIYPTEEAYETRGDASKCTSRGAGLHTAVIGQPNTFTVNASNAGRGLLMVGVEGPAIPAKEINVKHTGGHVYSVNYTLEETGDYVLQVLWSGQHIPGSPFHVTV